MTVSSIPHESWYVRQGYLGRGSRNNTSSYRPLSVPWQQLSNQKLEAFVWSYGSRAVPPETHHPIPDSSSDSEPEADRPSPRSNTTEQSTLSTLSLPETEAEEPPPHPQPVNWKQLFRRVYLTHIKPYEDTPSEYSRFFGSTRLIYNVPIAVDGKAAVQAWPHAEIRQRKGATNFDNILEVHWSEYFRRTTLQQ